MGRGFVAAADEVHVSNGLFIQYTKGIKPIWRKVDVTACIQRGRGGKENVLGFDKFPVLRGDGG